MVRLHLGGTDIAFTLNPFIWLTLPLLSLFLTIYLVKLYLTDQDKKKIIFVFSFAAITFSYCYSVLEAFNIDTGLFGLRFFDWTSIPIIIAVFIAANDFIFKPKNYNLIIKIFFIITFFSFILPFLPLNSIVISSYIRMIVVIEIIFATLFGYIKTRNASFVLFILAILTLSVGGMAFIINDNNLAIFGNAIGLIFLGLIFFIPQKQKHGISSYFSIKEELKDTKKALDESEHRYERIYNSVKDAFIIFDNNGVIVDANSKAFELYQYPANEFIGLSCKHIFHPDFSHLFSTFKKNILKHGEFQTESIDIKKEGTPFFVDVRGTDIEYKGKKHFLAIVRDISQRKKAENQLKNSRRQLSTLLNNLPGMAYQCLMDETWMMKYVSKGCLQLTEYHPNQLIENKEISYAELIHPDDVNQVSETISKALQQHQSYEITYRIITASGKEKWVWEQGVGVYSDKETIVDLEGFITDITEWKKADNELKKLSNFANEYVSIPLSINIYEDLADKIKSLMGSGIVGVNIIEHDNTMKLEKLVGISQRKLAIVNRLMGKQKLGTPLTAIPEGVKNLLTQGTLVEVHGGVRGLFFNRIPKPIAKSLEKMMGIQQIYSMGLRHEQELFGNVVIALTDDTNINKNSIEAIINQAAVVLDKRKAWYELQQAHKEIRLMNQHLEDKVEQRTQQIEQLLKQKDEFINQLGHDLKNPLGPLINLIPIIEKHTTNEKDKEILYVIQRNVGYMKNLVEKTLELARLNSPNTTLSKKTLNLYDVIYQIITQNKYLLKEKQIKISLSFAKSLTVHADKLRLEELFTNLLNNAIKYSQENGEIIIQASQLKEMVTISIQDTGIGMSTEQLDHVFDEFYKADESRHDFDSSGLGMAICKRIVEKHGGNIWVESEGLGKGSIFYISLPYRHPQKDLVNEKKSSEPDVHKEIDILLEKRF